MNLYAVQNQEGKFFKSIGYGGHGSNWVDTLEKAKFYAKIGQAKSRVTYFYGAWPEYGCPKIIKFTLDVAAAEILDMKEDTDKKINKNKRAELRNKISSLNYKIERDEELKEVLEKEINKLKKELVTL